jgi:hypothetical protein
VIRILLYGVLASVCACAQDGGQPFQFTAVDEKLLSHAITSAGGAVRGDFSPEGRDQDVALRQSLVLVRQKYENVAVQMRKKRNGVNKGRYTLGDDVLLLPCAATSDAVAFIDASGFVQTGGRKTIAILSGGVLGPLQAMAHYQIWIAFADSKSGEITRLFYTNTIGGKVDQNPDEAIAKHLVYDFQRMKIGAGKK